MSEEKNILKAPTIAWPTICVWLGLSIAWTASFALGATGIMPLWVCAIASSIFGFWQFVPFHEASHGAVARLPLLNRIVGHASAVILMAPFSAWCYVHREHHKHTNHPQHDPDHYAGRGPTWLLPLRWLTLDIYFYFWMRRQEGGSAFVVGLLLVATVLIGFGHAMPVLLCWLVPARITTGLVSFTFSYWPHHPHRITAKEDRYRATKIVAVRGLGPLVLYQNYHLIHHLYPGVPFYRYPRIYEVKRDELLSHNAAIWPQPSM